MKGGEKMIIESSSTCKNNEPKRSCMVGSSQKESSKSFSGLLSETVNSSAHKSTLDSQGKSDSSCQLVEGSIKCVELLENSLNYGLFFNDSNFNKTLDLQGTSKSLEVLDETDSLGYLTCLLDQTQNVSSNNKGFFSGDTDFETAKDFSKVDLNLGIVYSSCLVLGANVSSDSAGNSKKIYSDLVGDIRIIEETGSAEKHGIFSCLKGKDSTGSFSSLNLCESTVLETTVNDAEKTLEVSTKITEALDLNHTSENRVFVPLGNESEVLQLDNFENFNIQNSSNVQNSDLVKLEGYPQKANFDTTIKEGLHDKDSYSFANFKIEETQVYVTLAESKEQVPVIKENSIISQLSELQLIENKSISTIKNDYSSSYVASLLEGSISELSKGTSGDQQMDNSSAGYHSFATENIDHGQRLQMPLFMETLLSSAKLKSTEHISNNIGLLETQMLKDNVISQVSDKLFVLVREGKSEMEVLIQPDNLGKVVVRVMSEGGALSARLTADTLLTKELIQMHLGDLKNTLKEQGLTFLSLDVNFSGNQSDSNRWFHRNNFNMLKANNEILDAIEPIYESKKMYGKLNLKGHIDCLA